MSVALVRHCATGSALLGILAACSNPVDSSGSARRDSATVALYDSVGAYDVVPLRPSPISGTVVPLDMNDSGVVVGYIQPFNDQPTRPFRWRSGQFDLLEADPTSGGVARAINQRGDIVGNSGFAAIWHAGTNTPVALFPPESATFRNSTPVDINVAGDVVADYPYSLHSTVMRRGATGEIVAFQQMQSSGIDPAGRVLGVYQNTDYPYAMLARPPYTFSSQCRWQHHGTASSYEVNDSSIALTFETNSSTPYYAEAFARRVGGGCDDQIPIDPGFSMRTTECTSPGVCGIKDRVTLRTISNANWMAGTIRNIEAVMIAGKKGYVALDSVLLASGDASRLWRVTKVVRVNVAGTFLVLAADPQGGTTAAILVRRPK